MTEDPIGEVTHYFARVGVVILNIHEPLRKGDRIRVRGHTTDLREQIDSMEIEHQQVEEARPDDGVAIKVFDRVRIGDPVYRDTAETPAPNEAQD